MVKKYTGLILFLGLFIIHFIILPSYGFTWDFHYHFFGGGKLLGIAPNVMEPRNLPFVEPDPRRAWTLPYGPLMSIPPVMSYLLFYKTLSLLPADVSYNLPIILWGALGSLVVYLFIKEAVSYRAGVFSALFLALTPRFFGDLHNNMKDVPSAVIFALNMWMLWRLMTKRRILDLFFAIGAFAIAFNVKINSIYIPVVFVLWFLIYQWMSKHPVFTRRNMFALWYVVLAPVAAFLLWWVFWSDPIGQLRHAYLTFGVGTNNIEVLLNGSWYCSGSTVPWYYPLLYLTITTPLPLLFLTVGGIVLSLMRCFLPTHTKQKELGMLLIVWLFLPLSRYLLPSIGVIDGIRHFEETVVPIAILGGLFLNWIWGKLSSNRKLSWGITGGIFLWMMSAIVLYHPYQVTYFNEFVGGARGALGNYDLDYWGTSQKAAVEWVNTYAPKNAKVHIVMAAAVDAQYLRPDLLTNLNKYGYDDSDFVILLNRTTFLYRFYYAYEYLLHHRPIHTVEVQGAPLTWVFDNRTNNKTPRQTPFWKLEDPCIIKYWRGEHP